LTKYSGDESIVIRRISKVGSVRAFPVDPLETQQSPTERGNTDRSNSRNLGASYKSSASADGTQESSTETGRRTTNKANTTDKGKGTF
jgi:hypothetical protein